MAEDSIVKAIMKQYQKEYSILNEIYQLTVQLEQTLSTNDKVTLQLLLTLRQDELAEAEQCKGAIAILEDAMNSDERQRIQELSRKDNSIEGELSFEESRIMEINNNIRLLLDKTIEVDKRVNTRVAGKDSYYM